MKLVSNFRDSRIIRLIIAMPVALAIFFAFAATTDEYAGIFRSIDFSQQSGDETSGTSTSQSLNVQNVLRLSWISLGFINHTYAEIGSGNGRLEPSRTGYSNNKLNRQYHWLSNGIEYDFSYTSSTVSILDSVNNSISQQILLLNISRLTAG